MKEYYIFNLKNEFKRLYKDKPSELFFIFNRIYYMKEMDKQYGYTLFSQIAEFYDKEKINKFLTSRYQDKIMYSFSVDEHIINNLFLNEISILKVKNSSIRIETNISNPSFFKDLKAFSDNFFVCNFKEQDYFFLKGNNHKVKS